MYSKKGDVQVLTLVITMAVVIAFLGVTFSFVKPAVASPRYNSYVSANEMNYLINDLDLLIKAVEGTDSSEIYYNYSNELNKRYYMEFADDSITVFYDPQKEKYKKNIVPDKNLEIEGKFQKEESYIIWKKRGKIIFGKQTIADASLKTQDCPNIPYALENEEFVLDQLNDDKAFVLGINSITDKTKVITSKDKEQYLFSKQALIGFDLKQGERTIIYYYKYNNLIGELIGCSIGNDILKDIQDIKYLKRQTLAEISQTDGKSILSDTDSPAVYIELSGFTDNELSIIANIVSKNIIGLREEQTTPETQASQLQRNTIPTEI